MAKKIYGVIKADLTTTSPYQSALPEEVPLQNSPTITIEGDDHVPEENLVDETPMGGGVVTTQSDLVPDDAPAETGFVGGGLAEVLGQYTGTDTTAANLGPYVFTIPIPSGRTITSSSVTLTTTGTTDTDDGAGGWTSGTGIITYSTGDVTITFAADPGTGQIIADYTLDAP